MNELMSKESLNKLLSIDGIVELLCSIPNFSIENYENLETRERDLVDQVLSVKLITESQINGNLRRSMDNGNLALINNRVLTALSLLYFGVKDEKGKYVKYICPYTGKEFDLEEMRAELDKSYKKRNLNKTLELEHIMPHSSAGGTILFNCIPASREANSMTEKGNLHLLDWLTNEESSGYKYYQNGGVERLIKLVNYIVSAYEISFEEYIESKIDFPKEQYITEQDGVDNDEDIDDEREVVKKKTRIRETNIEGYIPFLNQLISQLEKEGYNTREIKGRLNQLEENGILNNLTKYKIVQETIEELFKQEDKKFYLTYSLNVDYIKLVNSIETNEFDEIKTILTNRFKNIKQQLVESEKSINSYFISLRDIKEIDLLYKDNVSDEEITTFINNIKLENEGKIDLFIEMLAEDKYTRYEKGEATKNNILNKKNEVSFEGYENIKIGQFWHNNSLKIIERIQGQLQELKDKGNLTKEEISYEEKLQKALKAIDLFNFYNPQNLNIKIDCFIEMLADEQYTKYENGKPDDNNIFKNDNNVNFKGYENIEGLTTGQFWYSHSQQIIARIQRQLQELKDKGNLTKEEISYEEKLQKAIKAIDCYNFYNPRNLNLKIDCFIEMLADEKYTENIFMSRKGVPYKGYENIEGLNTAGLWSKHVTKIIARLFYNTDENGNKLEKDYSDQEYDRARQAILDYANVTKIDEYIGKLKCKEKKNTLERLRENTSNLIMYDVYKAGNIVQRILNSEDKVIA